MPESLLNILKLVLLALLWLFFLRVLRAVWAEVTRPAPVVAPAGSSAGGARSGGVASPSRGRSAGPAAPARLRIVEPAEVRGKSYELRDDLTIGRGEGCAITVDDRTASQLHARIFRQDGRLHIEDLGSTNGTFLNAKKVGSPVNLQKGDRIMVGRTVFEVVR